MPRNLLIFASNGVEVEIRLGDSACMYTAVMAAPDARGLVSKAVAV